MSTPETPYCLFHKDGKTYRGRGDVMRLAQLEEIPRRHGLPVLAMVPYSQLRERDFHVHDDGAPILALVCDSCEEVGIDSIVPADPSVEIRTEGPLSFGMSDEEFAARTQAIIDNEICNGEGSNFLLSRKSHTRFESFGPELANLLFSRLVKNEFGAYLTFCFFDGERYFIGSSPERHITIEGDRVRMNPICGTLPKAALKSRADLVAFLADPKEINELFQVVDEELKMMSRICSAGGQVFGPFLLEMSSLVHTEYVLEGESHMDKIDAFRASMFAATMIGSPLENAARVIAKYESESRRYYSSALLLLDQDEEGRERLDSAITIRTMEVAPDGQCTIQTGASIVRDSVPEKETREIRAKAEGLLRAIAPGQPPLPRLSTFHDDDSEAVLKGRNDRLSRFWIQRQGEFLKPPLPKPRKVLIVDNEDEFTHMLKHILARLGMDVDVKDYDAADLSFDDTDLVLVGPGPGDPSDLDDEKIRAVHGVVQTLLDRKAKFLAVCLGHQVLCKRLGMTLAKSEPPLQGVQKVIDLFGREEPVGFYNTFYATAGTLPEAIEVAAEADGMVTALRSEHFSSMQFHVESVLTTNGPAILRDALMWLE